jgi:lipoprotein-anchoring transpeptidase ErfK/SrfK
MINRRTFIVGCIAVLTTALPSSLASAQDKKPRKKFMLDPRFKPQVVSYSGYSVGTIVIETSNHFLYLMLSDTEALRYGIGVGKAGLAFRGAAIVGRKAKWPKWRPTDNMIARSPEKYARFANGMPGGPKNPLGARALYLYRDDRDTFYRIHGTTEPSSIGKSISNGCIRMINDHVIDLYERVPIGATVVVKAG